MDVYHSSVYRFFVCHGGQQTFSVKKPDSGFWLCRPYSIETTELYHGSLQGPDNTQVNGYVCVLIELGLRKQPESHIWPMGHSLQPWCVFVE